MAHTIRTVVVHGATGLQGGTVTRALSAAGYHVRAAVRDVNAPKARELAKLPNVEHAPIDLSNIQKLIKTYTGADAVFACSVPGPDELQHGKNMADAAKAAGVKFYIWSALESIEKLTKGTANLKVPEFDNKAEVADYVSALGIPYTNLYLGGFMENFTHIPGHWKYIQDEDIIEIQYAGLRTDVNHGLLWVEKDLAAAVRIILAHYEDFDGKNVALADIKVTPEDMARLIENSASHKARAFFDPTFGDEDPDFAPLKNFLNGPYYSHYKGWPSPHPLLEKHRYRPSSFEHFVQEHLLPHMGL